MQINLFCHNTANHNAGIIGLILCHLESQYGGILSISARHLLPFHEPHWLNICTTYAAHIVLHPCQRSSLGARDDRFSNSQRHEVRRGLRVCEGLDKFMLKICTEEVRPFVLISTSRLFPSSVGPQRQFPCRAPASQAYLASDEGRSQLISTTGLDNA